MVATQFHPLLPDERATGPLLERAAALVTESLRLESAARGMRAALARFMRDLVGLEGFKKRLAALLRWLAAHP